MAKDQLQETLSLFEEMQDDLVQLSAELDILLEEHPAHPCLGNVLEGQAFLSDRFAFLEDTIAKLLAGAPVLLRSI